jgi:NhaA family Na+:H+ antiporter
MAPHASTAAGSKAGSIPLAIRRFLELEAFGGILLVLCAAVAMGMANSPLAPWYAIFLETPVEVRVAQVAVAKPLLLWINDGLMALFFLQVALEIKREAMEGELSEIGRVALPAAAAIGGMIVPSGIYAALNWADPVTLRGWAIPSATDIAFALGVLSLLGPRVPVSLKLFLLTLAVIDDLGAIVIIAVFYSGNLGVPALTVAGLALAALVVLNAAGVRSLVPYALAGVVLWVSVLKSGIHATLAGVVLGFLIPLRGPSPAQPGPLKQLEQDLHPVVAYFVLPLFAFANAGVSFAGMSLSSLAERVPLGIALGLIVGKPIGVLLFTWAVVRARLAPMPQGATWSQLVGVGFLCGIGFTMSLFIATLAFEGTGDTYVAPVRLGILGGSLLSALVGYAWLRAVKAGSVGAVDGEAGGRSRAR